MPSSWFFGSFCFSILTCICIGFIRPAFSSSSTPTASKTPSYNNHCSSIVPRSSPTTRTHRDSVPHFETSYFTGGERLVSRKPGNRTYYVGNSLRLRVRRNCYETIVAGVYKIEAFLYIRSPYRYSYDDVSRNYGYGGSYHHRRGFIRSIRFSLYGFWSEASGKLCMVGSATWNAEEGKTFNLKAVLKLNYVIENPTIFTAVVSGTLESTSSENDAGYFDPISMFGFPALSDYNYSVVAKEVGGLGDVEHVPRGQYLSLELRELCSVLSWRWTLLEMEYAEECKAGAAQHCSPLGAGNGVLPRVLHLIPIQCSPDEGKMRYMAQFQNGSFDGQSFRYDWTLIGEAAWDAKNTRLLVVACRILNPIDQAAVGDCTMRLSLRYPSIWTIRNDSLIVGEFWSTKSDKDPGYFRRIRVRSSDMDDAEDFPGTRYQYTEMERVGKSCHMNKSTKKGRTYPDGHSDDMRFDMSVKNSEGRDLARGYATPVFAGHESYIRNRMGPIDVLDEPDDVSATATLLNISYKISINLYPEFNSSAWPSNLNRSLNERHEVKITAEGVYSVETGNLCMVGCRKLLPHSQDPTSFSRDCDILVKFDFAPLNEKGGDRINGTIASTRAEGDPLYFEHLSLSSISVYVETAKQSIWRMDLEITLVLTSNTLSCIFLALQIFHVKRNPEVISCISLVMLLILSLRHMIPLVLNFEDLFFENSSKQTVFLGSGERLEAHEVAVRLITMVAFLLQIRLVQLVWTAKQSEGNDQSQWTGQKKASFFALPLYILGALFTFLLNWARNRLGHPAFGPHEYQKYSLWGDLRSYAGLIVDGFLLPQIILNTVRGSTEKALSRSFYIGTSLVRLVPHAYNQYRTHNYATPWVDGTYYYANPTADFYTLAWDVIIPVGVITLAAVLFLQQRGGGRCILPQRFRELELYAQVPVVDKE